jgi:hypothetical protein
MGRLLVVPILLATACAAQAPAAGPGPVAQPAPASTPAPSPSPSPSPTSTATNAPTASAPPAAGPRPTGGSVLLGDIASPKGFEPKAILDGLVPDLVSCYNDARVSNPGLRGKLRLRIVVNEGGAVLAVDAEPGGSANDASLITCIGSVLRGARFSKPGGTATVIAPLVFRP